MSRIKTMGRNGQISMGKEYPGRSVLLDELEPGVWILKLGQFIPDSERWVHTPEATAKIDAALAWAENSPQDNLAEFEAAVDGH